MGRSESKQAFQQGSAQSAQNQAQGAQAFNAGQSAISGVQSMAQDFAAKNPYGVGGQFAQDQSRINADISNAGTNSLNDAMRLNAIRTGQNAGSYAPSLAEAQRGAARDQATAEAKADQTRLGLDTAYRGSAIQMANLAPEDQARYYGTATGGATGNMSSAANAARMPGFWDTFLPAAAQGAGAAAGGYFAGGGCWIAEAIYGVDDARTHLVRFWLNTEFRRSRIGDAVMRVYLAIGKTVAACVKRSTVLRMALKPLFDMALTRATRSVL